MKRILLCTLALGMVFSVLGCAAFKKKTPDQVDEKIDLQTVKPEAETGAAVPSEEPMVQPEAAPGGGRVHVVVKGETLSSLARQYYGNENTSMWKKIWQANQAQVPNPNVLNVGQQLVIP